MDENLVKRALLGGLADLLINPDTSSKPYGQLSLAALIGLYLWDYVDGREARRYAQRYQHFTTQETTSDTSRDVSIVVPTVNWGPDLPANLLTWLINQPREVILVTTDALAAQLQTDLESTPDLRQNMIKFDTDVIILTVEQANKRSQLCRGINAAQGRIVALVDDDARWTTSRVLEHLLVPFHNEADNYGLVGGPIESFVPAERQNYNVITGWEVAALRIRQRRRAGMRAFWAADRSTNFTVSGLTMLLRTEIVQDPYFQYHFTHDMWNGMRQNTGDDGFITRYILFKHQLPHREFSSLEPNKQWRLGMQLSPEAEVQTSLMTDNRFADQSKRWYRSGLRLRLTCLLYEPGYRGFKLTAPYMARKMVGGMVSPLLTFLRLYLWYMAWINYPTIARCLILYVLWNYINSLRDFYRQFPYVGRKIWAAVVADHLYLVSDIFSWVTLSSETWSNRSSVASVPNAGVGE
ncbi:glycosyltransferase family 2 protein [Hypoxylon fuscum]|nr:glycosyltransferase family 2 protein [Hypoxylon fuscum]